MTAELGQIPPQQILTTVPSACSPSRHSAPLLFCCCPSPDSVGHRRVVVKVSVLVRRHTSSVFAPRLITRSGRSPRSRLTFGPPDRLRAHGRVERGRLVLGRTGLLPERRRDGGGGGGHRGRRLPTAAGVAAAAWAEGPTTEPTSSLRLPGATAGSSCSMTAPARLWSRPSTCRSPTPGDQWMTVSVTLRGRGGRGRPGDVVAEGQPVARRRPWHSGSYRDADHLHRGGGRSARRGAPSAPRCRAPPPPPGGPGLRRHVDVAVGAPGEVVVGDDGDGQRRLGHGGRVQPAEVAEQGEHGGDVQARVDGDLAEQGAGQGVESQRIDALGLHGVHDDAQEGVVPPDPGQVGRADRPATFRWRSTGDAGP